MEVAIDHLNRIVTPFASPRVRTVSEATTTLDKLGVVGDADPERDALIEGVRKEHARQLDALLPSRRR